MLDKIGQFRAKNQAAYDFIRELIVESIRADKIEKEATENVLQYLNEDGKTNGHEAIDLNEIFRFVLLDQYIVVIPRKRFGENDFLILKNFHPDAKLSAELIEFDQKDFDINLMVYLPGYLKRCLKRGLHHEC